MKNLSFILLVVGVALIGLALFMVASVLMGWNIFGWFSSKQAVLIYFVIAIVGITFIVYWWRGREK